jgi:hypothetical protein
MATRHRCTPEPTAIPRDITQNMWVTRHTAEKTQKNVVRTPVRRTMGQQIQPLAAP